jgi:hypothetical protein
MRVVANPNNWSCLAACAATIAGSSVAAFATHAGHDGSACDGSSGHPDGRRSFALAEARRFLRQHGWRLDYLGGGPGVAKHLTSCRVGLVSLLPATGPAYPHWAVWDGTDRVLLEVGPCRPVGPRPLSEVVSRIAEAWEVSRRGVV